VTYCLDAWAIISWLEGTEPAASRIEALLQSQQPVMSWINVGEVYYQTYRRMSERDSRDVMRALRSALILELPDEHRILQAATLKALHPVAYADAFAVATAVGRDAVLLTGDPEILAGPPDWPVEDLRSSS
jgi:predicted nucleic acid-binding protein